MKNKSYFFCIYFLLGFFGVISCSKINIPSDAPLSPTFVPEKYYPSSTGLDDLIFETGSIDLVLVKYVDRIGLVRFPSKCLVTHQECPELELVDISTTSNINTETIFISPDNERRVGSAMTESKPSNALALFNSDNVQTETLLEFQEGYLKPIGWKNSDQFLFSIYERIDDRDYQATHVQIMIYDFQTGNSYDTEIDAYFKLWMSPIFLSPDRSRIVYAFSDVLDGPKNLIIHDLQDGSKLNYQLPYSFNLGWSPNGDWLVLVGPYGEASTEYCNIQLIHPGGPDLYTIFTSLWIEGCEYTWSPDSKYLLVSAHTVTSSMPRLYLVSLADHQTYLVELPDIGVDFDRGIPSWNP